MDHIRLKIKEWSQAIRLVKLDGIVEDIESAAIICPSNEINNALYKLILYLWQTAQRDDKTNTSNGTHISNIVCAICSKLTSIPDTTNFFASIYHIVCHLIDMELYNDAMKVNNCLLPGTVFHAASTDYVQKYATFSNLWHKTINKFFSTSQNFDRKKFGLIMMLISYDLKMQTLSLKDGSKYLLNKMIWYNDKINSLGQQQYDEKFRNAMINFIAQTKISLGNENKIQTYKASLRFLNEIILGKMNVDNIELINDRAKQFFVIFRNCMVEDEEYYKCFVVYEQLCQTLIRCVHDFSTVHFLAMNSYIKNVNRIIERYGYDNVIQCNSYSILQVISSLQIVWSENLGIKKYEPEEFITNIAALIMHQGRMFSNFQLTECSCRTSDCQMTVDTYNNVATKVKVLSMIGRYIDDLSPNIISTTIKIAKECIQSVYDLQRANCKRWCRIWSSIGSLIHNIAVRYEKIEYDNTIRLYTLLATTTIKLNAFDTESSYVNSDNPLCVSLHRLSNTHYFHGKYDDAMVFCALNVYIGYKNQKCKGFRFWTSIKYKYPPSHGTTIINCLKSNKNTAQELGIDINLEDCDHTTICLREIKSLHEAEINLSTSIIAVLDSMRAFDVTPLIYAQCVQQLGYHMLNFNTSIAILPYINKALYDLGKSTKHTLLHSLLKGHLKFYELIEVLREISAKTVIEMKNTKIKLYATKDANAYGDPASNVVPAYTLINVTTAKSIADKFENILEIWKKCYEKMDINIYDCLEPAVTIRTAIVAAEYIRFYQYDNLETEAWEIAYSLANKFNNELAIVHIAGRCISSRHVNNEWIKQAESFIDKLVVSTDQTVIETVAMFKLSLSEYYFNIGLMTQANILFDDAMALPNIKFTKNLPTYLSSIDILLSHRFNFDYIENMVKGLYTMLTIDDIESVMRQRREERLYELDILFQFTNHITLRMNSLLSYREISAHLVRRLSLAQKLGALLHVAECLKNLCFIDLSRNELEDCEVKLQGLEHILMMETVEISMQSDLSPIPSVPHTNVISTQIMEPVRDVFQNDTSPVLRTKVCEIPNFMSHDKKCKCFNCCNVTYQNLVFSCTHIRAKLYASQNHVNHALQHFESAFDVIRKVLNLSDENVGFHSYHDIVEYVLFLLDFARFLKHCVSSNVEDGLNIALHAVEVCEKYKTVNSPVYLTARELVFEYRFQNIYKHVDDSNFTMPNTNNIDVSKYFDLENESETICITPARTAMSKSVQSVRRKKSPPLLSLSKVSINTVEEDDRITMSSLRPAIENIAVKKKPTRVRPIRREIFDDISNGNLDGLGTPSTLGEKSMRKETVARIINNVVDQQICSNKKCARSGLKLKKLVFGTSGESSEERESVDEVSDMLKEMRVSTTICSKSRNEVAKSKNISEKQLTQIDKEEKKLVTRNHTCSIYSDTIVCKPSNGRKKSCDKVSLANSSSSSFTNSSEGSNENVTTRLSSNRRRKNNTDVPLPTIPSSELMNTASSESNDEFSTFSDNNVDSDVDVVECSIEEPRRSRRLATRKRTS